jgi:toxin CcdB
MARFDVYQLGQRGTRYVVDVQSDFLSHLATRVVAPLFPAGELAPAAQQLNPDFLLNGAKYTLFTQLIAAVAVKELKHPVTSLIAHRDTITCALYLLLTGF